MTFPAAALYEVIVEHASRPLALTGKESLFHFNEHFQNLGSKLASALLDSIMT
jgi:hypothetical protein